jgi:hypothetical protein
MLNNTPLYLELVRERTHERVFINLINSLETIKKYDEKQQFMNMLGQDDFWKKNRLDLWRALKQDSVERCDVPKDAKVLPAVAFQNTPQMLPSIKERLKDHTEVKIQERRELPRDVCGYDSWNHIYNNGERTYVSRAVKIDVPNHFIRTEDVPAFNADLKKLLDKYVVKDPLRLKNGQRRLNFRTVANRYVERVYGFKPEKNDYRYW